MEALWLAVTQLLPISMPIASALAMRLTAQAEQAWNLHGPTEAAGWAIAYRLDPMPDPTATPDAQADAGDLMPIGWPLANLYALVVNEHGLPVPDGGHGELWLSGLGLARALLPRRPPRRKRHADGPPIQGAAVGRHRNPEPL